MISKKISVEKLLKWIQTEHKENNKLGLKEGTKELTDFYRGANMEIECFLDDLMEGKFDGS